MAKFSNKSLEALNGVHPNLVKVLKAAIINSPIDFTIVEGVRTQARQQSLYAQGRTAKGSIVTYADGIKNKSNHQPKADGYGHAIDFAPYINGKLDWNNIANFKVIADHIVKTGANMGIKVEAGYYWKRPVDPPHIQLWQKK